MRYLAGILAAAALSVSLAPRLAAQVLPVTGASATPGASAAPQSVIGNTGLNPSQAHISGRVMTPGGNPMANTTVRARNLLDGQIGASTSTASAGQFAVNVNPGSYLLEVVDAGGQIVGTSSFISAAAGTTITTATVTASTGVFSAVATTAGLVSTLGSTAARSVTYAAAAAGVAGIVTPADMVTASPSR